MWIRLALILPTLAIMYWFWIRPILMSRPSIADFLKHTDSHFEAIRLKLQGVKQQLAGSFLFAASTIVELYDYVAPALGAVDTTPLIGRLPAWLWPIIAIASIALLNYLRHLGDVQNAKTVAVLADTLVVNNVPIPAVVQPVVGPLIAVK